MLYVYGTCIQLSPFQFLSPVLLVKERRIYLHFFTPEKPNNKVIYQISLSLIVFGNIYKGCFIPSSIRIKSMFSYNIFPHLIRNFFKKNWPNSERILENKDVSMMVMVGAATSLCLFC
jgi:hypothetical protein